MSVQYLFTESQDWFSFNEETWRNLFVLVTAEHPRVLEIGSWEGRSAVFLLTELCRDGGELVCIDHFDLMGTPAGCERYRKLTYNLSLTGKRSRVIDQFSVPGLMTLLHEEMATPVPGFDWIYIDGSHEADDTFLDGELAWRLARKGAIVIFDDYHWNKEPEDSIHHPKRGIDAFLTLHAGEYSRLSSETQYQVVLQKNTEMRIGFLVKDKADSTKELEDALGYGINIALTIDADYAIAAAVTIRSATEHTRGRITFYILGRDLTDEIKEKLRHSISDNANTTIVFIDLPSNPSLSEAPADTLPVGLTWAKITMISSLPVERVLYLDADVLVRQDVRELWDTDLEGKAIAAAPDVGFPMGHEGIDRARYFNAGVILMDLTAIRKNLDALHSAAVRMKDSKYQDQDALNVHFRDDWLPLSLRWNAQGLGTYAKYHTPERAELSLKEMDDPSIVHFTGSLHPSMAEVIDRFVQPFGGKPWGYAGAPGHPYTGEWWQVCQRTAWKDWRSSQEFDELRVQLMEEVIANGLNAFRAKVGSVSDA